MKIASVAGAALAAGLLASQANAGYMIESDGTRLALSSQESVIVCTNSGTLKVNRPVTVEFLLLGGGGGGGGYNSGVNAAGGGGGAGGFIHVESLVLNPGEYNFTIGAGGAENARGGDSSFNGYLAYGGGPGASEYGAGPGDSTVAYDGASGGGACGISNWNRIPGKGTAGQGHDGGTNLFGAVYYTGLVTSELRRGDGSTPNTAGGGGGAGAPGGSGTIDFEHVEIRDDGYTYVNDEYTAGAGGDGLPCSITGEEVYYAGGGAGGQYGWYRANRSAPGGKGGGGAGGLYNDFAYDGNETHGWMQDGADGVDGFGGGGGGAGTSGNGRGSHGGKGGCGVLIIRYAEHFKPGSPEGTGGTITKYVDEQGTKWIVHTFTESGSFTLPVNALCDVLVVGGGGGGGNGTNGPGGGGGAGGFIYRQNVGLVGDTYAVTVGAGGEPNLKGGDSDFAGLHAFGGGAGKHDYGDDVWPESDGGSGGGACGISNWRRKGGTGVVGQGYDGGSNTWMTMFGPTAPAEIPLKNWSGDDANSAGGGGGAGAPGGSSTYVAEETKLDGDVIKSFSNNYPAGDGGDGLPCSITGEEVWYAGGGGGGEFGWYRADYRSSGGKGGGGKGGYCQDPTLVDGEDGVDGLGGGGGGGCRGNGTTAGGKGGSGIVIVRYRRYKPGLTVWIK